MLSLTKARNTLDRWFHQAHEGSAVPARQGNDAIEPLSHGEKSTPEQRVQKFMQGLRDSQQEWLGSVRMISFDSIRERVGSRWDKLRDRVEILAEKLIGEEVGPRDRYVNAGDVEFLIFFADATAEESRLRCLAIVEMIHEKLFGTEDYSGTPQPKVAECRVIHKSDLILEWELASDAGSGTRKALRSAFRNDPEALDVGDIAGSAQEIITAIVSRGTDAKTISDLAPLLTRLRLLSRSLKALEPALIASLKHGPRKQEGRGVNFLGAPENAGETHQSAGDPLATAWDDIVDVISILDAGPERAHADVLESLRELQRDRLARAISRLAGDDLSAQKERRPLSQFGYLPIYRSVSQGERIHAGLYRMAHFPGRAAPVEGERAAIALHRRKAIMERLLLEHAIRRLLDRKTSGGFMLLAPVGVETLHSPRAQRQYSTVLRSAELQAKRRLLIEVNGYSSAENTLGMRRAIQEVRLHCRAIFITLCPGGCRDLERTSSECKGFGAHAIGVDASQLGGEEEALGLISQLASTGAQNSLLTYVGGIESVSVLAKAIAWGISYVCAPGLRPALPAPKDAERATIDDLYCRI